MNTCYHCKIQHARLSCPYCGVFTDEMSKVMNRRFRGSEDFGKVGTERHDVHYVGKYLTDTGARLFMGWK